jgi:hypothetical protein
MTRVTIDPELASEVSAIIHECVPDTRILFAKATLSDLDGADLEKLMSAAFLMGYGEGLKDASGYVDGAEPSALMQWGEKQP